MCPLGSSSCHLGGATLAVNRAVPAVKGGGMRHRLLRAVFVGGLLALSVVVAQAVGANGASSASSSPVCPSFSSTSFHNPTRVTNLYFPLRRGDLYTYRGNRKKAPVVNTVYVTRNTKTIDGVATVEVRDQVYESGVLTED